MASEPPSLPLLLGVFETNSPAWPSACYVAEDGIELLVLLHLRAQGFQAWTTTLGSRATENGTHSFTWT